MMHHLTDWFGKRQRIAPVRGGESAEASPRLSQDDRGATALEWALLLVVMAIPAYFLFSLGMAIMVEHYQMVSTLNALPLP